MTLVGRLVGAMMAASVLCSAHWCRATPPADSTADQSFDERRVQLGALLGMGISSSEVARLEERRTTHADSMGVQALDLRGQYALLNWLALGGRIGFVRFGSPLERSYYEPPELGGALELGTTMLFMPPARGSWQFYGGLLGGVSVFPHKRYELSFVEVESSTWIAPHWGTLAGVRLGVTQRFSFLVEGRIVRYRIDRTQRMRTTTDAPVPEPLTAEETDRFFADTFSLALGVAWSL